jgi:carbonic anhydrase
MTTPIQASAEQLAALTSLFEHANNRPVQELNTRTPAYDFTN